jgi:hypothetical protein
MAEVIPAPWSTVRLYKVISYLSSHGPYPEPDESSSHFTPHFFGVHFNVILPSTLKSLKWSLPFTVVIQMNLDIIFLVFRQAYMYISHDRLSLAWSYYFGLI